MNGVHDMGGLQCFGAVNPDPDEPLFHAEWESKVLALTLAMGATGQWNIDESRFARESLPPSYYLSAGYYRIWLAALEQLLLRHELVSQDELRLGSSDTPAKTLKRVLRAADVPAVLSAGSPVERRVTQTARFAVGDKVTVRNRHTSTHTRLPAYIRGRTGSVHAVHGAHVYPDTNAMAKGEQPQWLYNIVFDAVELWGESSRLAAVHVDCWEPYLERVE
ncbi:MAG: nitrile hydratase subunit beta [Gammaproteobacteria bacterium]|nr:nitrile hydratase subunit beta [Gammaproteobacteria bacterium]